MELYHRPVSRFVAEFIGSPAMNVFDGSVTAGLDLTPQTALVGCRPEHFELLDKGEGHIDATLRVKERLGAETLLYLDTGRSQELVARVDGDNDIEVGVEVGLRIPTGRLHQFDAQGHALRTS
jgi:ABC-type sugar transport system ATPase subunit